MKTILVPTDFSSNSENAFRYTLELNKKFDARIILFHAYTIPVYATDLPIAVSDDVELIKQSLQALEKMKEKILRLQPGAKYNIDVKVAAGFPEDEIRDFAKKNKADLVVMGTKGASGMKEIFLGTNTASTMEKTSCPVMAIPEQATYHDIKKIVFATNFADGDFENIEAVINFAKPYNAEVILLHVLQEEQNKAFEYNSISQFEQRIKDDSRYPNLTFKLLENKNTEQGLMFYLDEIKADVLAMTMRHRTFWQKLMEKSLTKKMVYHTHLPFMIFHDNK